MAKPASVAELIQAVRSRPDRSRGLRLAVDSVASVRSCLDDPACAAQALQMGSPAQWEKAVGDAWNQLTWSSDGMAVLCGKGAGDPFALRGEKKITGLSAGSIFDFECVVTTPTKDRVGDVLETKGGRLDPRSPLLWQHINFQPIGKLVRETGHTSKRLTAHCMVLGTALGTDAAYLAEHDCLRISHGFKPEEWEALDDDEEEDSWRQGFRITKFEILEISLVSVPANPDAVIIGSEKGKLAHPVNKAWAAQLRRSLPRVVAGGWDPDGRNAPAKSCGCADGACACKVTDAEYDAAPPCDVAKPYPNEHACRLLDPGKFKKDSFRRVTRKHDGKDYAVIMGKLKTGTGSMKEQAYRYPKKDWTAAAAKAHCGSHDGTFEAAGESAAVPARKAFKVGRRAGVSGGCLFLEGSYEWTSDLLDDAAAGFLAKGGVAAAPGSVCVVGTFDQSAVLSVQGKPEDEPAFFECAWTVQNGDPVWTGEPSPVELSLTVSAGGPQATGTADDGKALAPRDFVRAVKGGKISQRNLGKLQALKDLINEITGRVRNSEMDGKEGAVAVCERAATLLGEVLDDVGAQADDGDPTGGGNASADALAVRLAVTLRKGGGLDVGAALALREELDAEAGRAADRELAALIG